MWSIVEILYKSSNFEVSAKIFKSYWPMNIILFRDFWVGNQKNVFFKNSWMPAYLHFILMDKTRKSYFKAYDCILLTLWNSLSLLNTLYLYIEGIKIYGMKILKICEGISKKLNKINFGNFEKL